MSEKSVEHPLLNCFAVFKDQESWNVVGIQLMRPPEPFHVFASPCSLSRRTRGFIFEDQSVIDALLSDTDPSMEAFQKVVLATRAIGSSFVLTASEIAGKQVSFEESIDPVQWVRTMYKWQPSDIAIGLLDDEGNHCVSHLLSDDNYLFGILDSKKLNHSIAMSPRCEAKHLGEPERVSVSGVENLMGEPDDYPDEQKLCISAVGSATGYLIPDDPHLPTNFMFIWDSRAMIWNQSFAYPPRFLGTWVESLTEPRVPCERRIVERFDRLTRLMPVDVLSAGSRTSS